MYNPHRQTRIDAPTMLAMFVALEKYGAPASNISDGLRACVTIIANSQGKATEQEVQAHRYKLPEYADERQMIDTATKIGQKIGVAQHSRLDEAVRLLEQQELNSGNAAETK